MSESRKRFQVTLLSLLVATALIGAGIGCYLAGSAYLQTAGPGNWNWWRVIFAGVLTLAAGPLVGAGLLAPLRRMRLGAYLGIAADVILIDSRALGGLYVSPGTSVLTAVILASFVFVLVAWNCWDWFRTRGARGLDNPGTDLRTTPTSEPA